MLNGALERMGLSDAPNKPESFVKVNSHAPLTMFLSHGAVPSADVSHNSLGVSLISVG